eukprot:scaffold5138_cov170-Amphora_coffeaeformis.AAC.4
MKLILELVRKVPLAVVRLPSSHPIPPWVLSAVGTCNFVSITKTSDELSIVCPESSVPEQPSSTEQKIEKGWVSFKVRGPLDFGLTGILAGLASPLAEQGISIFAISTYDTDYILVKENTVDMAAHVFRKQGHAIVGEDNGESSAEKV